MGDWLILSPESTTNYIVNPSVETDLTNWQFWSQEATFEDGQLTPSPKGFDTLSGTTANLQVRGAAALRGDYGLACTLSSGVTNYGTLTGPNSEKSITIEFFLNPNTLAMANSDQFNFINAVSPGAGSTAFVLVMNRTAGGVYQLVSVVKNDAAGNIFPATYSFTTLATTVKVRMEWQAASAPAANNGIFRLYVNNSLVGSTTTIDNDTHSVTDIQAGAVSGVDAGTSGTIYLDSIRWAVGIDYSRVYATVDRVMNRARFGSFGARIQTDGLANNEGIYIRTNKVSGLPGHYTASVYLRGNGKLRLRLVDGLTGTSIATKPFVLSDGRWRRYSVLGIGDGSNDLRLYIETADTTRNQAVTFYADGAQIEPKEYLTTYCDGRQPECRWNGVVDASVSERLENASSGGRWLKLSDPDSGIYATVVGGTGMPPVEINYQKTAQYPGGTFDNVRISERVITMTLWAVPEVTRISRFNSGDISGIQELRSKLIDMLKPDRNPLNGPLVLGYESNGVLLTTQVRYEGGLEFAGDVRNQFYNTIAMRFLALDPFWYEDSQETFLLDTETTVPGLGFAAARVNGRWQAVGNSGFNDNVYAITEAPDGRIYFGGEFTADGGGAQIRRFGSLNDNFSAVVERGNGLNGVVRDIKAHPNGKIYICGDFTADGPGALSLNCIAEYNPETNTLVAMGTGLNALARRMAIGPDGSVYVVGNFSQAGGKPAYRIARWDGSIWHYVGNLDTDRGAIFGTVLYDIIVKASDEIYVCGQVVKSGAVIELMEKFNGTTWSLVDSASAVGGVGAPGPRYRMIEDLDGTILGGGASPVAGQLQRWNGSSFVDVGDSLTFIAGGGLASIFSLAVDKEGKVYVGGNFSRTTSGMIFPDMTAIWNGSVLVPLDVDFPSELTTWEYLQSTHAILVTKNGDVYVGWEDENPPASKTGEASGIINHESPATADSIPTISVFGAGRILFIENQTTGQRVYLNYTVLEDEVLELDFSKDFDRARSNYAGTVANAILPNSDDIKISPRGLDGKLTNKIAAFMVNEVSPLVQVRYTPRHLSFDAVEDVD